MGFFSSMTAWLTKMEEFPRIIMTMPRVFSLVFKANALLAGCIVLIEIILGLVPLANVIVFKLLFDSVPKLLASSQHYSGQELLSTHFLQQIPDSILQALGLLAFCWFAKEALAPGSAYAYEQMNDCLTRDINLMIMDKASSTTDITILENPKFYDHLQRVLNELTFTPIQMLSSVSQVGRSLITLASLSLALASFSPQLVLFIIVMTVPQIIFRLNKMYDEWDVILGDVPEVRRMRYYTSVLTNNQDGKEIRLFGLSKFFRQEFLDVFSAYQKRRTDVRKRHLLASILLACLSATGTVSSYIYTVLNCITGKLSTGSLAMCLSTIGQMEDSIGVVMFYCSELYRNTKFVNSLYDFIAIPPSIPSVSPEDLSEIELPIKRGIEFRNVSFKYPNSERLVLDNISFKIEPGQSVALVGENGAGKTTIVKLLSRLYDPSQGQILVDGVDLKQIDPEKWRELVAVVFQDFCRFHLSIKENIGIGNVPLMTNLNAIKSAAEKGGAAAIAERLQDNYETMLGKMFDNETVGTELSGGEWQKIALSRAFMRTVKASENGTNIQPAANTVNDTKAARDKQAQLLILDEPTASLDVQAEYDVYCRFHELTADKMALLITHRFSTVKIADRILVLEDGKIIEDGPHDVLIARDSVYAKLYNLQADRYR